MSARDLAMQLIGGRDGKLQLSCLVALCLFCSVDVGLVFSCSSLSWLILGGLLVKESNLLSFPSCVSCAWTQCFTAAVDDGEINELLFVLFGLFLLPQNQN